MKIQTPGTLKYLQIYLSDQINATKRFTDQPLTTQNKIKNSV